MTASDHLSPQFEHVQEHEGRVGDPTHITRGERGLMPTSVLAAMPGVKGEVPGEHRNHQGARWDSFKTAYAEGKMNPVFITVDHGEAPKLSEGNHRRDAAVELGHDYVPYEAKYYGHAEQQGLIHER
jgi:hypothetical protein